MTRLAGVAALLPLLLVAVSVGRYSQFRCVFTGAVSVEPCCPGEETASPVTEPRPETLSAASCCTHETVEVAKVPSEGASPSHHEAGVPVGALAALLDAAPLSSGAGLPARRADAPARPPILLVKRTLLI
jgi:hypothetical protein